MQVRIIETGEIKTLAIYANGCNWVADLIGNHDGFGKDTSCQFKAVDDEELGLVYETSQANFDWWEDCIAGIEHKDRIAETYAEKHGWDAVYEVLRQAGGYDLEYQARADIAALEEAFGEIEK